MKFDPSDDDRNWDINDAEPSFCEGHVSFVMPRATSHRRFSLRPPAHHLRYRHV